MIYIQTEKTEAKNKAYQSHSYHAGATQNLLSHDPEYLWIYLLILVGDIGTKQAPYSPGCNKFSGNDH